mgnify:FL=1|tara:strand:+ start:361 stop:708 length:348 start_codon:yes stop_codon:yes gene_type:complete
MNNNELFMTLVSSLASQAWMQLGKIKNPITDKVEKDLGAASMSIDMLSMIQEKTKGNLEDYESQLLEKTLNDLRMNFVFEKNQDTENNESKESDEPEKPEKTKKAKKKSTPKKKK